MCQPIALMKDLKIKDLKKVNVTITLGPKLAIKSKAYAKKNEMSLSEMVAILLRRELTSPSKETTLEEPDL